MSVFAIILSIILCFFSCYLFYKILEINKDIDILYDNYSNYLESITKNNIQKRGSVLK